MRCGIHVRVLGAAAALLVVSCESGKGSGDAEAQTGSTGPTATAPAGGGGATGVDATTTAALVDAITAQVTDVLEQLSSLKDAATAEAAAAAAGLFCQAIDSNPNYTSNTIFSALGKKGFATAIRSAYDASATLRTLVQSSGYWAASGETTSPDTVITQTGNSCETNIGFINAVCFPTGPQYTSGGSYQASGAVNSGGCNEAKK